MTTRTAQLLVRLYPPPWRRRYEKEFEEFLVGEKPRLRGILDVVCWAVRERINHLGEFTMNGLQRSLVWMVYACLAAMLAGGNLWWTVDDTQLALAMQQHALLSACWEAVEAGSLLMAAAALASGLPAFLAIVQFARSHRRWDVLMRLAFPPAIGAVLLSWTIVAGIELHWLPTPWDVTGDWTAPASWPPLPMRWALSAITAALLAIAIFGTAVAVKGAIQRMPRAELELASPWRTASINLARVTRVAAVALTAAMVVMLAGVTEWGLLSQRYDSTTFYSRAGGFFGVPLAVSWAGSVALFLVAAVTAWRGAHLSPRPNDTVNRA